MRVFKSLFLVPALLLTTNVAYAKWKIATLEWPPFACEKCKDQGAGVKALREAAKAVGEDVEIVWLPWSRAIQEAKKPEFIGYWPAWPEDCVDGFFRSESLFSSPFGIAENKDKPLTFTKLIELKGKTIASVQDYGNTKEFNELIGNGTIKKDLATEDGPNLKKLAIGRIDGAVIDSNVFNHMVTFDLKDLKAKLQMNPTVLEVKTLGIALGDNAGAGKKVNEKFVEALKKVNTQKIVDDYLKEHFGK